MVNEGRGGEGKGRQRGMHREVGVGKGGTLAPIAESKRP